MSFSSIEIPERFLPAYQVIQSLAQHERYCAAFIFGSLARGEAVEKSDFDVKVIVNEDNPCKNINHPIINCVKLDITFISFQQIQASTQSEMEQRERIPIIAESLIVFDKTGELARLQTLAQQVQPKAIMPEDHQFLQFMFYHLNDKVVRHLESDPIAALYVMHIGLEELLKFHFRLQQKWWVSSKRMLRELHSWDNPLAQLVEGFVTTCDVHAKFQLWSAIIDHIEQPLGGRQPIADNNCDCEACKHDLVMLQNLL